MILMLLKDVLGAHMTIILQQLIIGKVEILKVVLLIILVLLLLTNLLILWPMIYLVIFNMEQTRVWYTVTQLLVLHSLEIHFEPFQMDQ